METPPAVCLEQSMALPNPERSSLSCPVCGEKVAAAQIEAHLRQRHQIFQFRGERRSPQDTLNQLISLVLRSTDKDAWQTLQAIARELHGSSADRFLSASITAALARLDGSKRDAAITAFAGSLLGSGDHVGFVTALATEKELLAQQVALQLALRWPGPLPAALIEPYASLLIQRRHPAAIQVAVTVAFLRSFANDRDPRERTLLEALIAGMSKVAAVKRLYDVQTETGPRPQLTAVRERIENQIRMSCPRCGMEMRRAEMIDHIWREHGLVLDGQKVRDPWVMIQDWLDEADGALATDVMTRSQSLAQQVDPENGVVRLHRMILQAGLKDSDAQKGLLSAAKERSASICPGCYALVPVPRPLPGNPLNRWQGRLSGRGYRVEIREQGFLSRLELDTPSGPLYRSTEPGRRLTLKGRLWMTAGPLVFLAYLLAIGVSGDPLLWVCLALTGALIAGITVSLRTRPKHDLSDRVVDHAWSIMLPRLSDRGFQPSDAGFLAGLALVSLERGKPEVRRPLLEKALRFAAAEVLQGREIGPLAALKRLGVNDAVKEGRDPIPLVLEELDFCLKGKLPLAYGEALLTDWQTDWWTAGNLARLRALLADRAFDAGFEVTDLIEIGQSYVSLGSVLDANSPRGLVNLRLLWSMRANKPWDRNSPANHVFDVALRRDSSRLFSLIPDVLLVHENADYLAAHVSQKNDLVPLRIVICGRGVVLQDVLFEKKPSVIEVSTRRASGHWEMRVGSETFRFSADPTYVADRLERFFRFLFNDFLPQTGAVMSWKSPDVGAKLRARGAKPCPECHRPLLPRVGSVAHTIAE